MIAERKTIEKLVIEAAGTFHSTETKLSMIKIELLLDIRDMLQELTNPIISGEARLPSDLKIPKA